MRLLLTLFLGLALTSCDPLSFGEDTELTGAAFDTATLESITLTTGLTFPQGSEGLHYFYRGSGIDDSLGAKVLIPAEKKEEFFKNAAFTTGKKIQANNLNTGFDKSWWTPETLAEPISLEQTLPGPQYLTLFTGIEEGSLIAYICWFTL